MFIVKLCWFSDLIDRQKIKDVLHVAIVGDVTMYSKLKYQILKLVYIYFKYFIFLFTKLKVQQLGQSIVYVTVTMSE